MEGKQVFQGVKVADFSWVGVGPQTARELAEHGATVIRIEYHRYPEILRLSAPFKDSIPGIDRSAFGACYNTNKYGISLDLNKPKGQEVARRLVKWADIVTDGMIPGVMKKWGLDYEGCRQIKPDIIYYSTNQQGQHGPHSRHAGYGLQTAPLTGFSEVTGWADRPPTTIHGAYTDFISPFYLAIALIAALDHRRRTGKGMHLEQSQLEAGISFLGPAILDYAVNGRLATRMGNRDPYAVPHGCYRCLGVDRWCVITVRTDEEWEALCQAMGEPDWTKHPKFSTFLARKQNEDELDRLVERWTLDYTPEEVMYILQTAGVPAGVVQNPQDLFEDPQVKHRGHFQVLEHKVIGAHAYNAPAYKLSKTPARLWKAGPCLGEDNEYVYKEILGYGDEEIADLLAEGVITTEADVPGAVV